jgi:hypothetical protein
MARRFRYLLLIAAVAALCPALADDLTRIVQQDLVTLGYEPGDTNGEATTKTVIAISKFQAEHSLDVTGEPSPQLAGIIKAAINQAGSGSGGATAASAAPSAAPSPAAGRPAAPAAAPSPPADAAALRAAQQACLQQRMTAAQKSKKKKRGFARLARAVGRTAAQLGGDDVSRDIADLSANVYAADSIAGDFKAAAEDLGLTDSDVEACRNPQ